MPATPSAVLHIIGSHLTPDYPDLQWDMYAYLKDAAGDVERIGQVSVGDMPRPYGDLVVSYDPLFNGLVWSAVSASPADAPDYTYVVCDDSPLAGLGLYMDGATLFDLVPTAAGIVKVFVEKGSSYLTTVLYGWDGVAITGASYYLGDRPMVGSVEGERMSWVHTTEGLYGVVAWHDGDMWKWAWADVFGPLPLSNTGVFPSIPSKWSWRSGDPAELFPAGQLYMLAARLLRHAPAVERATVNFYTPSSVTDTPGLDIGPFYLYRTDQAAMIYSASRSLVYTLNKEATELQSTAPAGFDVGQAIEALVGSGVAMPAEYDDGQPFGFYLPGVEPPSAFWTRFVGTLELV